MSLYTTCKELLNSINKRLPFQLFGKGFQTMSVKMLGLPLAYGLQIVLTRVMSVEAYGAYAFAISWLSILTLFTPLGFNISYLRFIPEYQVNKKWDLLKGIIKQGERFVLLFSCLVGVLAAVLSFYLIPDTELRYTFLIMCLVLPFRGMNKLRQSALKAYKFPVQAFFPNKIFRPLMLATFCFLLFRVSGRHLSANAVMALKGGVIVLIFFLTTFLLSRKTPDQLRTSDTTTETKTWLHVSLPLLLASGLTVVFSETDILMVGFIAGKKSTGLYNAATRICVLLTIFYSTAIAILTPKVSELYHSDRMEKLQRTIAIGSGVAVLGTVLATIPFVIFGKYLLFIFGESYTQAYPVLLIIPVAYIYSATRVMAEITLRVSGHQMLAAKIMGGAVVLNVLLNALLIPTWGITGAATATTISTIIANSAQLYYAKKLTNLEMTWLWFFTGAKHNTTS